MEKKIGKRVASYREKMGLTIEELADRTTLDAEFLKALESEDMYPSLGPLLKIARVLGVRLGTFLDDQVSRDPLIVRLADQEEELIMHRHKDIAEVKFHSLGKGKSDRHMEPFFVELLPETEEDKTLSSHEGEEFIIVKSGKVAVTYGKEESVLEEGDSIYFNSVVPHNVSAAGGEKAEIYAVLYFPQ